MSKDESNKLKDIVKKVIGDNASNDQFIHRFEYFKTFLAKDVGVFSIDEIVKIYDNISVFKQIYDWIEVDDFISVLNLQNKENK